MKNKRRNETIFKNFQFKNTMMEQDKLLNQLVEKQTPADLFVKSLSNKNRLSKWAYTELI